MSAALIVLGVIALCWFVSNNEEHRGPFDGIAEAIGRWLDRRDSDE